MGSRRWQGDLDLGVREPREATGMLLEPVFSLGRSLGSERLLREEDTCVVPECAWPLAL